MERVESEQVLTSMFTVEAVVLTIIGEHDFSRMVHGTKSWGWNAKEMRELTMTHCKKPWAEC